MNVTKETNTKKRNLDRVDDEHGAVGMARDKVMLSDQQTTQFLSVSEPVCAIAYLVITNAFIIDSFRFFFLDLSGCAIEANLFIASDGDCWWLLFGYILVVAEKILYSRS